MEHELNAQDLPTTLEAAHQELIALRGGFDNLTGALSRILLAHLQGNNVEVGRRLDAMCRGLHSAAAITHPIPPSTH